jgi:hypothetical protein
MRAFPVLLAALIALNLFSQADGRDAPDTPPAGFKITTRRADDAVAVRSVAATDLPDRCPILRSTQDS